MAAEKVTLMVLKVDLQCPSCFKKTRRTLCKFPQKLSCEIILCGTNIFWTREIRDQIYDEKANTVTITVVCCSPEKIRDRLCCKGGKAIKSIEIKDPTGSKEPPKKKKEPEKPEEKEKPKAPEKPKVVIVEPKQTGKPKEAEKQKEAGKPKEAEKPKSDGNGDKPKSDGNGDKPKSNGTPPVEKQAEKPKEAPKAELAKNPGPAMNPFPVQPVKGYPGPAMNPFPIQPVKGPEPVPVNGVPSVFPYVGPSYDGYYTGPYYHGYGFPPAPQPCYEGYYGHGYGYGYGGVENVNRGDGYFSEEENPEACSIM